MSDKSENIVELQESKIIDQVLLEEERKAILISEYEQRNTMGTYKDAVEESYNKEGQNFNNSFSDEERMRISQSWFNKESAGMWRFRKAYTFLEYFQDKSVSWLTVGDGRWGLDAINIMEHGFKNVMASDITEILLKAAKEKKLLTDYSVQNAEKLTFDDNSFDYVFCKESFHHFPRPYLALYEMLRVARKGVFLIEPSGQAALIKDYMAGYTYDGKQHIPLVRPVYEGGGNYVYTISAYEIFKVAYGLNLPQVIFSGYNDHYVKGIEFEPADIEKSEMFKDTFNRIQKADTSVKEEGRPYHLIMAGLMKEALDIPTAVKFDLNDWRIFNLERNPHL